MGIGDGHQVVVYDQMGIFSAPRVWWNFRLMGKTDIAVLDGGLPKWIADGHPTEDMPPMLRDRHITVQRQAHLVKDVTQVAHASKLGDHEIIDARPHGRFIGQDDEPRPNLRKGHIPGAKNVPWDSLLNADATLKSPDDLRAVFAAANVDTSKPAICTCGSGVSAAMLTLALERIGQDRWSLYDGAWAEWGMYNDLRVATGEA